MNAYDDYAAKIKDKLESLDEAPVVPMVPARGNDGIGGRDRSKVRAAARNDSPVDSCSNAEPVDQACSHTYTRFE